jgi:hypothetical protein
VLPISKPGRDQNVPHIKAGGNHYIPEHQVPTCEVVTLCMEAIALTKMSGRIISDEMYSTFDEAWKQAIEAQKPQWALAGAPEGTPSVS